MKASVVIPAHNEERSIARLLGGLKIDGDLEVIVACNGCSDATAQIAGTFDVTVLDLPQPGKVAALRAADECATVFPRVYVDADVELGRSGLDALIAAIRAGGVLAAGPRRVVPRDGVPWPVAAYYDVWELLPAVQAGLFGRGVIAVSEAGFWRLAELPEAMADDLAFSEAFRAAERVIEPQAQVIVHPPRTWGDLIRRRTRISTGNAQADTSGLRTTRTGVREVLSAVAGHPSVWVKVPVFLVAVLQGRIRARKAVRAGDFSTWERDASSRGEVHG